MPIEGVGATQPAITYLRHALAFREAVRENKLYTPEFESRQRTYRDYYKESTGRRTGFANARDIDYISRHGEVVDVLMKWRGTKGLQKGLKVVKDVYIDLGVKKEDHLIELYEVKSSSSRQDVYTAIGQLTVHAPVEKCKRFLVLPDKGKLMSDLADALDRNDIQVLRYHLTEDDASIVD